jgi:hypothetical protein
MRAEIESDLTWRVDEIRSFRNIHANSMPQEQIHLQRGVIVLVYAHAEGLTQFALETFIRSVPLTGARVGLLSDALVSACLADYLRQYREDCQAPPPTRQERKRTVALRDLRFVEGLRRQMDQRADQRAEAAVILDSNLSGDVLLRSAVRFELDDAILRPYSLWLDRLVEARNAIAHGRSESGANALAHLCDSGEAIPDYLLRQFNSYGATLARETTRALRRGRFLLPGARP